MSRRADVCVLGSFMMDLVVRAPRRPQPGETVFGRSFEMFLGGKGFNQAVAAARNGAVTTMVGRVGSDDFGVAFVDALEREGIDATHVRRDADGGTGVGLPIVEDSGENSIVVVPRANQLMGVADVEEADDAITGATVLLLQLELPLDVGLAAARAARAAGVVVVLNPAPADERLGEFRGAIDVLVPNESEARALTGLGPDARPDDVAARLRAALGADIVLTLGSRGALVADADGVVHVAPHDVESVDSVGAGDAFCGVLGAELARGASLREAVERANAAGALAVTTAGAEPSMPHRDAIDRLVKGGTLPDGRRLDSREIGGAVGRR